MIPAALRGLRPAAGRRAQSAALPAERLLRIPEAERDEAVLHAVLTEAAVARDPGPAAVSPDRAFLELGFDSQGAVELRNRLSGSHRPDVCPRTLVFDQPHAARSLSYLAAVPGASGRWQRARRHRYGT